MNQNQNQSQDQFNQHRKIEIGLHEGKLIAEKLSRIFSLISDLNKEVGVLKCFVHNKFKIKEN